MQPEPTSLAKCRLTAIWQLSMRPSVPLYCRCTPTEWLPFFANPVSSTTIASTPGNSPSSLRAIRQYSSSSSQVDTETACCSRCRMASISEASSTSRAAIGSMLLRSPSSSRPTMYHFSARRRSGRPIPATIESMKPLSSRSRRSISRRFISTVDHTIGSRAKK